MEKRAYSQPDKTVALKKGRAAKPEPEERYSDGELQKRLEESMKKAREAYKAKKP